MADSDREKVIALHKPESEYADLNIRDLKQRIVNKGLPVKYFQTCGELGAHVFVDWKAVIDELYPPLFESLGIFGKLISVSCFLPSPDLISAPCEIYVICIYITDCSN